MSIFITYCKEKEYNKQTDENKKKQGIKKFDAISLMVLIKFVVFYFMKKKKKKKKKNTLFRHVSLRS